MERWRRGASIGCAGAMMVCVAAIFAPFLCQAGSLALAKWRWAQSGGSSYTLVVSQFCNCYITGEYRLTVLNGAVRAATLENSAQMKGALPPDAFEHLTVEAVFAQAEREVRRNWWPDWNRRFVVEYDPALGYVTHLETGDRRAPQFYFVYNARDVESVEAP